MKPWHWLALAVVAYYVWANWRREIIAALGISGMHRETARVVT